MADLTARGDAVTGIKGTGQQSTGSKMAEELVDRHLTQWQLFIFEFLWGMQAGITRDPSAGGGKWSAASVQKIFKMDTGHKKVAPF